jgi:hypothetical protein
MVISISESELTSVWWANSIDSFFFPIDFFSSEIYLLTFDWLKIRLRYLFIFAFYAVILILWLESRVWCVNLDWPELFFCIFFLINFSISITSFNIRFIGGIELHNCFQFNFYVVILISWSGLEFDGLARLTFFF